MSSNDLIQIFIADDQVKLQNYLLHRENVNQSLPNLPYSFPLLMDSPPLISIAAFFGAYNCFQYLFLSNANITALDKKERSLVHFACCGGNLDILDILDSLSADFKLVDSNNVGCLHYASQFGHINVVQRLWQRNFPINEKDSLGMTPIHYSAMFDSIDVIDFFYSKGISLNPRSAGGTPFSIAVKNNCLKVVIYLLNLGVSPNQIIDDDPDENALFYAIRMNFEEIAIQLIKNSTNYDKSNSGGWTALHMAASLGRLTICKELINNNANVNSVTFFGATPLLLAKNNGFDDVVSYLEDEGGVFRNESNTFVFRVEC